jgi:hypothetical protein
MSLPVPHRLRALALGALSIPLALGAAACSSDKVADKAADRIAEKIAESASGEGVDVSIDSESGEFSFETDDGSTSFSLGGGKLPEGWPEEIPVPDDFEVKSALATETDGDAGFNAAGTVPGDAGKVFEELAARFVADGWTEQHKSTGNYGDTTTFSASYDNGTWQVMIGTTQSADGEDLISYTVFPSSNG